MLQDNVPLQVPAQLLKNALIKNKELLEHKYDYEKIGNNQLIQIEPAVAKFSGFEVNKLNILKVRIVNKSQKPQRVLILPPMSPFFSIKYEKKGLIASGMAEDIYIHFKPSEYKYYYDALRINSGDEALLLPIHAYPALNRESVREIFPRLIDFGTVEIGQDVTYRYQIQCKIPLNFEFEFVMLKESNEIKISPLKGFIPGRSSIEIEILYAPLSNVTVVVEVELKISQFDFEPLQIKVMGSGRHANQEGRKQQKRPSSNLKLKSLNGTQERNQQALGTQTILIEATNPNVLETDQNEVINPAAPFKTLMKSLNTQNQKVNMSKPFKDKEVQEIPNTKVRVTTNRQAQEKAFLDHFNRVQSLDKEKEIKFFPCIGDGGITDEDINSIQKGRGSYIAKKLEETRQAGVTRYQAQFDSDQPILEEVVPRHECSWDTDKNDTIKIKRIKLNKLVYVVTRVIYRIRFENRILKIKAFLKGAKSREVVRKMVNQDWQKAEYAGVGKKDFVQFSFEFNETNIGKFQLPVQLSSSNNFSSFRFDINPRTGFDDWINIEQIPYSDQEVMQYKNWDYPQLVFHPPLQQSLDFRTGSEEEYAIRGRMGPVPQQTLSLQGNLVASVLQKQPFIPPSTLLQQHPTLKQLSSYNVNSPIEPFYLTSFSEVNSLGADLDPDISLASDILRGEFLSRTPGYSNINLLNGLTLEQGYYQRKTYQIPNDFGLENEADKYCPQLMADKEYDDHITDDDSDGEGPPQLIVVDVGEFLKKIEGDDKIIASIKERNRVELFDQQEDLEDNINQILKEEKDKFLSTLPSKTADFNKFMQCSANRLLIL